MQINNLTNINFKSIVSCFNQAFANYFVPINATEDYLSKRWMGARIDPKLSFGVYDSDKIVAFMFIGIDNYYGKLTAHNDGTGVIPAYRGNRLVDKMYKIALPKFKASGIEQCSLEVIQKNAKAINVYTRIGFKKTRGINCYAGEIIDNKIQIPNTLKIKKTNTPNWSLYPPCFDFTPSWNNSLAYIQRLKGDFEIIEMHAHQQFIGFGIVNIQSGSLPIFGIHPSFRRQGYGQILFEYLAKKNPKLRTNNIEDSASTSLQFLERMGMQNTINQEEMLMVF